MIMPLDTSLSTDVSFADFRAELTVAEVPTSGAQSSLSSDMNEGQLSGIPF